MQGSIASRHGLLKIHSICLLPQEGTSISHTECMQQRWVYTTAVTISHSHSITKDCRLRLKYFMVLPMLTPHGRVISFTPPFTRGRLCFSASSTENTVPARASGITKSFESLITHCINQHAQKGSLSERSLSLWKISPNTLTYYKKRHYRAL